MRETSKSKKTWGPDALEWKVLRGTGIDIGAGSDPVFPGVRVFDMADGDANEASKHVHDRFDYVYASHCLEHMHDPRKTAHDWWKLVKPGGHLYVTVPDEDLYEQGVFPSRFNPDHKATFTVSKTHSWSPLSVNVLDLARSLPGGEVVRVALQDLGYDRRLATFGPRRRPGALMRLVIRVADKLARMRGRRSMALQGWLLRYRAIDQTREPDVLCQIQCIVKKLP